MLFTTLTILIIYLLAAAFIIGGFATKNVSIVTFGIGILFLGGAVLFRYGMSEKSGELKECCNSTAIRDDGLSETVYVYDDNKGFFTQGLGVLSFLIGAALAFYLVDLYNDGIRRRNSGEED